MRATVFVVPGSFSRSVTASIRHPIATGDHPRSDSEVNDLSTDDGASAESAVGPSTGKPTSRRVHTYEFPFCCGDRIETLDDEAPEVVQLKGPAISEVVTSWAPSDFARLDPILGPPSELVDLVS